jgi:hypothetical protein
VYNPPVAAVATLSVGRDHDGELARGTAMSADAASGADDARHNKRESDEAIIDETGSSGCGELLAGGPLAMRGVVGGGGAGGGAVEGARPGGEAGRRVRGSLAGAARCSLRRALRLAA